MSINIKNPNPYEYIDANIVGSFARIDKGIASGFSASSILALQDKFNNGSLPWEMVYKITTGDDVSTTQHIVGRGIKSDYHGQFYITSGKWGTNLCSSGTTWNLALNKEGGTVTANTTYWIKFSWDGSVYKLEYSTDNETFTTGVSVSSTTAMKNGMTIGLGASYDTSGNIVNPFKGSIDLSQSYININGERWWSGDEYTKVGSWIDETVVSGFTTSSYLKLPAGFNPKTNTWEMQWKFTTGSDVTTATTLFAGSSSTIANLALFIKSSQIYSSIGNGGSSWLLSGQLISEIEANTEYLLKIEFTGAEYNWYLNGELKYTWASTSNIGDMTNGFYIGVSRSVVEPFSGSIDLSQSYIKINGEYWWRGVEVDQYREIKRLYQYKEPTYYKYGTEIDATVNGNFGRLDKGVASGFTTANYLQIPETVPLATANTWEKVVKFTYQPSSAKQAFMSSNNSGTKEATLGVGTSGLVEFRDAINSSSFFFDISGSTVLTAGNTYWVKGEFTGSEYNLYLSTNGIDYVLEASASSTTKCLSRVNYIGTTTIKNYEYVASSSIDLSQSYININGSRFWSGDSYTKVGSWIDDGVASGFSASNYLNTPESFNVTGKQTWEEVFKITTSSDVISAQSIVGCNTATTGCVLQFENSNFRLFLSSGSSSWNIAKGVAGTYTLLPDTTYWFKIEFTGTAYIVSYSLNGVDYIQDIMVSSSTPISSNKLRIGSTYGATTENFSGSIDLTQSYIKINDKMWWHGTKVEETTADDYEWLEKIPMLIKQVYKTDKPKYYKRVWEDYTLPVMTSNTSPEGVVETDLTVSGLATSPYSLFFGNGVTVHAYANRSSSKYIKYTFANLLRSGDYVFGYAFSRNSNVTINEHRWEVIYDDDTTEEILNDTNIAVDSFKEFVIPFTAKKFIKAIKVNIYLYAPSDQYCYANLQALSLTAQGKETNVVEKLLHTYEVNLGGEDVYGDWEQPVLTANGTMGGDKFAVAQSSSYNSSDIWKCFSGVSGGQWHSAAGLPQWVSWYNPEALKVSKISIVGLAAGNIKDGIVQACNDNSSWVDIVSFSNSISAGDFEIDLSSNDKVYKYWRIYITSCYYVYNGSYYPLLGAITINAQIIKAIGGNDHDYSELIPTLVYEHNPIVFQQSTAGTYTFNVTEEAPYEITLVGGGGGGAFNSSGNAGSAAAGNSGSGLVVNAVLKAGTYVLNVGAGGAWSGWLDANTWGGNGSQSSISKDGVVLATAGGGTGNHCWWRSGSAHNSTVGAAPTYTDALGVRDVILNTQGNWGGLAATSSGGASVISGTTWGKGGNTRDRNAADNGNAGCIRIVRLEK